MSKHILSWRSAASCCSLLVTPSRIRKTSWPPIFPFPHLLPIAQSRLSVLCLPDLFPTRPQRLRVELKRRAREQAQPVHRSSEKFHFFSPNSRAVLRPIPPSFILASSSLHFPSLLVPLLPTFNLHDLLRASIAHGSSPHPTPPRLLPGCSSFPCGTLDPFIALLVFLFCIALSFVRATDPGRSRLLLLANSGSLTLACDLESIGFLFGPLQTSFTIDTRPPHPSLLPRPISIDSYTRDNVPAPPSLWRDADADVLTSSPAGWLVCRSPAHLLPTYLAYLFHAVVARPSAGG